jgi:hypothetical protein
MTLVWYSSVCDVFTTLSLKTKTRGEEQICEGKWKNRFENERIRNELAEGPRTKIKTIKK